MIERNIAVATPDGTMETFVVHPQEGGPFPGVVIYMDVWGIREELRDIARRVATAGYYCMLPDLYHRSGKVSNEFRDANGRMRSFESLSEADKERVREPMLKLTDAMVLSYTRALIGFAAQGEPMRDGPMGAIGYCMGGRHIVCVAGGIPERFRACAGLHGTRLVTDAPDSPHRIALKARGELYMGFAELDPFGAPPVVKTLADTLAGAAVNYRYEIHRAAHHGYALPDRDVHDKQAANRDWEIIFEMFNRQIPAYRGAGA